MLVGKVDVSMMLVMMDFFVSGTCITRARGSGQLQHKSPMTLGRGAMRGVGFPSLRLLDF